MATPLRVLIVGDSDDDAALLVAELDRGGFEPTWQRVATVATMGAALAKQIWDVVIAGESTRLRPRAALRLLHEQGLNLPLIVVSEVTDDKAAVAVMRAGARDCIAKGNLRRLVGAVERELRDAALRRELRHTAGALRESEHFAERVAAATLDILYVYDIIERRPVYANRRIEDVLGYTPEQAHRLAPLFLEHVLHPDDRPVAMAATERFADVRDGQVVESEWRLKHADGEWRWLRSCEVVFSRTADGRPKEVVGTAQDVTERKRAERLQAAQYAVTRVLAESASLAEATPRLLQAICRGAGWELGELWHVDPDADVLRFGGMWHVPALEVAEFEAISRDSTFARGSGLPGRVWESGEPAWITDVGAACFLRAAAAAVVGLRDAFAFPVKRNRAVIGVMVFFSCDLRQPNRELLQVLEALGSQIGDFIARRRAEDAIRDSEARFHAFMDNSPAVQFMKDDAGHLVYINSAFERFFHTTLAQVRGKTDFDLWPPDVARRLRANDIAVLERNEPVELAEVVPTPDGNLREWMVVKFPITDADGRRFVGGIGLDLTERKRAEAKVRDLEKLAHQRERLADIGAITAKILHDLANPLAGLSMQAQLILRRASRSGTQPVSSVLLPAEHIVSEVRRLDSFISEFMDFAREQRLEIQAIHLRRFLRDCLDMWEPVASAREITLDVDAPDDVPVLHADGEKLRRVFDNLLKNAVESIDHGPGRIGIRITVPAPEKIRISVEDTGSGIPETLHVFRLFETTKPHGTGLGLAIAKQIVQAHGGSIDFAPVKPHGTVFHIEFLRDGPTLWRNHGSGGG